MDTIETKISRFNRGVDGKLVGLVDELVSLLFTERASENGEVMARQNGHEVVNYQPGHWSPPRDEYGRLLPLREPAVKLSKESLLAFVREKGAVEFDAFGPRAYPERTIMERLVQDKLLAVVGSTEDEEPQVVLYGSKSC